MRRLLLIGCSSALLLQVTPLWAAPVAQRAIRAKAAARASVVTIDGKAQSAAGQALPAHVQLRSLETGRLVGTATCNSQGEFSFDHRQPGNYAVELVNPTGAVVGSSSAIVARKGAAVIVTVAPTTAAINPTASTAVTSTASVVTTTAAAAGISGVVSGRNHPSPSF
jgi:hypothetical protein